MSEQPEPLSMTDATPRPRGALRRQTAVVIALTLLPFGALFARAPGTIVRDTRLTHVYSPTLLLERHFWLWTDDVGLGGITAISVPFSTAYTAIFRLAGLDAWVAQRFWLAGLLALAAVGTALLAREIVGSGAWGSLVAGLWVISSPYTINFLIPSWLFMNAAVAPWLMLAMLRGAGTARTWRWAALAALLLAVPGLGNLPGLIYAAVPLIPLAFYLRLARRVRLRHIASWCLRVAVFAIPMFAHALFRASAGAEALALNLELSETIESVSQTPSWSESLRGLGTWLNYWPALAGARPYSLPYLSNPVVLVVSFLVPVVAVLSINAVRRHERVLITSLLIMSVVIMVGSYSGSDSTPYGQGFLWLHRSLDAFLAFRNSYKVGIGLVIALGLLLAAGSEWLLRRTRKRSWRRPLLVGTTLGVLVAAGWPMWTGSATQSTSRLPDGIPDYWIDAVDFLNAQPDRSRVLAVPALRGPQYRWGTVADGDVLSVLSDRPVLEQDPFLPDPADSNNLVLAIGDYLSSGVYEPGSIRPLAERVGLGYLVIRNDLRWERSAQVRPSRFDALRNDPDLELVGTFGEGRDDMVVAPGDDSELAAGEALLPAVEIYRVRGIDETVRAQRGGTELIVSGDGEAWPALGRRGVLDSLGPISYSGRLDVEELVDRFDDGSGLVISDSNRRTFESLFLRSYTVSAETTGSVSDRFRRAGTQTVADYGDATRLVEFGRQPLSTNVWDRPAAMFDGDPATQWLTGARRQPGSQAVRIHLAEEHEVSQLSVRVSTGANLREVSELEVGFSDGSSIRFETGDEVVTESFSPRTVSSITVRPLSVDGDGGGRFGLSEVAIEGVDVAERLVLPDDIARMAEMSSSLRDALRTAPTFISTTRRDATRGQIETAFRRNFTLPVGRTFEIDGAIQPTGLIGTDGSTEVAIAIGGQCRDDLVAVDGRGISVRLVGDPQDLSNGGSMRLVGCEELPLDPGEHEIATGLVLPVRDVLLRSTDQSPPTPPAPLEAAVDSTDRNRPSITFDAQPGDIVISGQAADPGWRAMSGSADLGPTRAADLQGAWVVGESGEVTVDMRFGPDREYRILLVLAAVGLLAAIMIAVVAPASCPAAPADGRGRAARPQLVWGGTAAAATVIAWFLLGLAAAVIVALSLLLAARGAVRRSTLVVVAACALMAAGFASLPPIGPSLTPVAPTWPRVRDLADVFARLSLSFLLASIVTDALANLLSSRDSEDRLHSSSAAAGAEPPPETQG